jgi:lysozyme
MNKAQFLPSALLASSAAPYLPPIQTDCVTDIYHGDALDAAGNDIANFVEAVASGIKLVIHKATQGSNVTDNLYAARKPRALAAGALWGAYHFCDNSDPIAQAKHFLAVVGPTKGILLMLDAEINSSQVTIAQVAQMITYIKAQTGQTPLLYMGRGGPDGSGNGLPNMVLSTADLNLPEYGDSPILPPGWSEWKFHQYTGDGINGSGVIPGLGSKLDRSYFAGTVDDLVAYHTKMTDGVVPINPSPTPAPLPTPSPTPIPKPQPPSPPHGDAISLVFQNTPSMGFSAAVSQQQTRLGLDADGVIGPDTLKAFAKDAGLPIQ